MGNGVHPEFLRVYDFALKVQSEFEEFTIKLNLEIFRVFNPKLVYLYLTISTNVTT